MAFAFQRLPSELPQLLFVLFWSVCVAGCSFEAAENGSAVPTRQVPASAQPPAPHTDVAAAALDVPPANDPVTPPKREQPAGHAKMVELLAAIRESTNDDDIYQGDKLAREHREKLSQLAPDASPRRRVPALYNVGVAELRIGNEQQAIERLTEAYQLLPAARSAGLPEEICDKVLFKLGVAHMRLAETENCCAQNSPESCIVPIAGGGLHTQKRGSRKAIQYLKELYDTAELGSPTRLEAQWLLNIAHMTLGEYPDSVPLAYLIPEKTFRSTVPFPKFVNIAASVGLDTFSLAGGVVCDDMDEDGDLDLIVSTLDRSGQIRYFRNNADGTFSDQTVAAGLEGLFGGLNLVHADYNNDGHVDVLVLRGAWLFENGRHPNSLLRNNGDGTFTDVTFDAGLGEVHYPTQTACWADYDLDGDLDLYIGNESHPRLDAPCQLFRNNGDGTFRDVADQAGVRNMRFAKSVSWGDFDADRDPDLYVSNYGAPNRLYRNNGDGTFTDVATAKGVDEPRVSFPAWFFDVNNDGALDIFVSSYAADIAHVAAHYLGIRIHSTHLPRLYLNHGDGTFDEVSQAWDIRQPTAPMGSNFGDLDGDGFVDFYLGTGDPSYKNIMPNIMYHNVGGERFVDVTMAGGFGHLQKGHAVVFADIDHDGDQDVFEQLGGAFLGDKFHDALFENPGFGNRWVAVRLVGISSNRSAIGARIRVVIEENGKSRSVYKWVNSGATFGSNPLRQHIGLGKAEKIERVEVFWPQTGETQTLSNVPLDRLIRVTEDQPDFETVELKPFHLGG